MLKKVQKHTKSKMAACLPGNSRWPLFSKIVLVDTFNLICYLPWFLSVITKRDNFRTCSSDDEGTLTKRHFSQLLPGYQTATLVIMFTKWPLMKDLKRYFADTPRTQNPLGHWTIQHVSTLFFLRHLVSLSRAMELDIQFMKTIASNNYACEYGVHLTMVNRCKYHTVRPVIVTRYIPLLDIKPSDPPIVKTAMVLMSNCGSRSADLQGHG